LDGLIHNIETIKIERMKMHVARIRVEKLVAKGILFLLFATLLCRSGFCSEIHDSAKSGDLEKVKSLIKSNGDLVNGRDDKGETPLHWAVRMGYLEVARLLVANKADVNAKDKDGETPLHLAAEKGFKMTAEFLVAKGADVNVKDDKGRTPVQVAAATGHADVVELLSQPNGRDQATAATSTKIQSGSQTASISALAARTPLAHEDWRLPPGALVTGHMEETLGDREFRTDLNFIRPSNGLLSEFTITGLGQHLFKAQEGYLILNAGQVVGIEDATISVLIANKPTHFKTDASTKVLSDGNPMALRDFRTNDIVTVITKTEGDVASRIVKGPMQFIQQGSEKLVNPKWLLSIGINPKNED
jgi:hypothetical protein